MKTRKLSCAPPVRFLALTLMLTVLMSSCAMRKREKCDCGTFGKATIRYESQKNPGHVS